MAEKGKSSDAGAGKPKPTTIHVPTAQIELHGQNGFRIILDKFQTGKLMDQSRDMLTEAGQGCISSPTGPSC